MTSTHEPAGTPRHYLVVANRTLGGPPLGDAVYARHQAGPARFHFLVPSTPPPGILSWSEEEAHRQARERLDTLLHGYQQLGISVSGSLGDIDPALAARHAQESDGPFDEVIVATHPPGVSRWLKLDAPSRIRAITGLPVTHVIVPPAATVADDRERFQRWAAGRGLDRTDA